MNQTLFSSGWHLSIRYYKRPFFWRGAYNFQLISATMIPYTRKFPRYVNFADFAINSSTAKIKSAEICQSATITESIVQFLLSTCFENDDRGLHSEQLHPWLSRTYIRIFGTLLSARLWFANMKRIGIQEIPMWLLCRRIASPLDTFPVRYRAFARCFQGVLMCC